ncbi:tetratricopeptide repeat protein [Granulicella arctica]|uniref:Tetratricopeptide (TPR) repeat protein n=1 Tax=Granulicella arctica TaxID=940613 RepID=A0A7Y9THM3_9BACT|nr:tetratricopeptide repeat protein [Granulicella arctica]NYF80709.1 tetratricopeptide (TPR) repeat protein [Granulicella arctica]
MATDTKELSISRRKLILRDSVAFLSLTLITVVLFAITLFLFRSFMAHRTELAKRWSDRGQAALTAAKPEQAIAAYRTALSYAPGEHAYELKLAQALGEAGRTEESYNYFMGLWETEPGSGFINLQLARLAAQKRDVQDATNFYRASIYGTWEGDGVQRRREVRLELAQYLISQHDAVAARTDLLIAGGNAPDTPEIDNTLARMLEQAGDAADALSYYRKAIAVDPKNQTTLDNAANLAYAMGDFNAAHTLLERAVRNHKDDADDVTLLARTERLLQLMPAEGLSAKEKVDRALADRAIAKKRLNSCIAQRGTALPAGLQVLNERWANGGGVTNRAALLQDTDKQAAVLQLTYDTEMELETDQVCGSATGDDALLLLLAKSMQKTGQ